MGGTLKKVYRQLNTLCMILSKKLGDIFIPKESNISSYKYLEPNVTPYPELTSTIFLLIHVKKTLTYVIYNITQREVLTRSGESPVLFTQRTQDVFVCNRFTFCSASSGFRRVFLSFVVCLYLWAISIGFHT